MPVVLHPLTDALFVLVALWSVTTAVTDFFVWSHRPADDIVFCIPSYIPDANMSAPIYKYVVSLESIVEH